MVTENVNIAFRSTGIPVIIRQIDGLGGAANKATRGFFLLQRAMFTIGGFGLARMLTQSADALTNMENRLRLTTNSTAELERVQNELFEIAKRSRTSWEGVTEIYNRAALSAKALGISQKDVLTFTEGISKAAVVSGAGAQEARAALIQMGQAVASNRLGGDELRSVLEQLPMAADVIAEYMTSTGKWGTVTRGNIRQLGKEGKITAEVIVESFKHAENKLNGLFNNMPLTIGQAIENLKTSFMQLFDQFEDSYDISGKLAKIIQFLADNLNSIARVAAIAAGSLAVMVTSNVISMMLKFVSGLRELGVRQTAILAKSVQLRTATIARMNADIQANAVRQAEIGQNIILIQQKKALLFQEALETEFSIKNGRARSLQTGQFVNLANSKARLEKITIQLSRLEAIEAMQAGRLARARAGQASTTNALAGANARLAGAQAAQAGTLATLTARFPLLGASLSRVIVGFRTLAGLALSNPIGLVISAVSLAIMAFMKWGNEIKVTSDRVVGLKDFVVAAMQILWEKIVYVGQAIIDHIGLGFKKVGEIGSEVMSRLSTAIVAATKLMIDGLTAPVRLVIGIVAGVISALETLPEAAKDVGIRLANFLIDAFEMFANGAIKALNIVISGLNSLMAFVGANKAAEWFGFSGTIDLIPEKTFDRMKNSYSGAGKAAADAFEAGFTPAFNKGTVDDMLNSASSISSAVAPYFDPITDRARLNLMGSKKPRARPTTIPTKPDPTVPSGKGGDSSKSFADLIQEMQQEIQLLGLSNKERAIATGLLDMEKELKRGLTEEERNLAVSMLQSLESAKLQSEILNGIVGPAEEAADKIAALNAIYAAGKINIEQYTKSLRDMKMAADEASGTLMGGFRSAIASSMTSAMEFGKAIGNEVVGFVNSASDAIVDFAKTGKFSLRDLFGELFANLLKLASQRLMLMFLGNILGIPGGGMGGGAGGLGSLFGFAGGGSILPTGPGSTDSQIVAFKKRPDERVDILTPGQQSSQRNSSGGGSSQNVTMTPPPVNVSVVLSEEDIGNALSGKAGNQAVVRAVERNKGTIRKILS